MKISAYYDREKKTHKIEVDSNATIKDILKKLDINPVTVIVSKNDTVLLEDETVNENDELKIISVVSGG